MSQVFVATGFRIRERGCYERYLGTGPLDITPVLSKARGEFRGGPGDSRRLAQRGNSSARYNNLNVAHPAPTSRDGIFSTSSMDNCKCRRSYILVVRMVA